MDVDRLWLAIVRRGMITGEPFTRFYAGLPLRGPAGYNIATLCLMDTRPRELSLLEIQTLKQLGEIAKRVQQLKAKGAK